MTNNFLQRFREKIITPQEWLEKRPSLLQQKVVFTNGCFDVLHLGHITYLAEARNLGDLLVVGLNTDNSVRRLKGPQRPINNEEARSTVLAALTCVDYVILFDEDTPKELIETVQPNVLVKGGDYTIDTIVGAPFVLEHGGEVKVISFVEGYSSTQTIQKMASEK